jgi:hypothetical protein
MLLVSRVSSHMMQMHITQDSTTRHKISMVINRTIKRGRCISRFLVVEVTGTQMEKEIKLIANFHKTETNLTAQTSVSI